MSIVFMTTFENGNILSARLARQVSVYSGHRLLNHTLLSPGLIFTLSQRVYRHIPAMGKASTVRSGWLVECGCFEVEVWRGLPSVEQRAPACDGARIAVAVAEDETDQTRSGGSSLDGHESEGDW